MGKDVAREVTWKDREDKVSDRIEDGLAPSKSSRAWAREAVPAGPPEGRAR